MGFNELKQGRELSPLAHTQTAGGDNVNSDLNLNSSFYQWRDAFVSADSKDEAIDYNRWDKLYPYELIFVQQNTNEDGEPYYYRSYPLVSFVLPITPEALQIMTPFAMNTIATVGGVAEEHNGAPFKLIQLRGSTGVNPLRGRADVLGSTDLAHSVFGGTIESANRTIDSAKGVFGGGVERGNWLADDFETELLSGAPFTGYAQFRMLQRFLEHYAAVKKGPKGKTLRLALAIWKDQSVYLVTPMTFTLRRDAESPFEYNYDLQFRAWKRVTLTDREPTYATAKEEKRDGGLLQDVSQRINMARRTIQGASATIEAVRADVAQVMEIGRQAAYFVNDAIGVASTLADLPVNLARDLKQNVIDSWKSIGPNWDAMVEKYNKLGGSVSDAFRDFKSTTADATFTAPAPGAEETSVVVQMAQPSPLDDIFDNTEKYAEALAEINVAMLNVSRAQQEKLDEERTRTRNLRTADFEQMRDDVLAFSAAFADAIGAGDATFDAIYGKSGTTTTREPTPEDFDVLYALNDLAAALTDLITLVPRTDTKTATLDYVAGIASRAGVAFKKPVSKYAVPMPYGFTLEQLARTYLGSPDRWMEIAVLNGLREPYVDEEGFMLPLLSNAKGNQVTVADATNLYIGQPVWLVSSYSPTQKRHILGVSVIAKGSVVLTLSGEPDLDAYTVTKQSAIHAYLPDTVNSQMVLYLPSEAEGVDNSSLKKIPGVDEFDSLLEVGGVDLLLTLDNDLAVTPDGDSRWAYGMTNLTQRVRIGLATPRGSLLRHPNYGLPLKLGTSLADLSAQEVLRAARQLFSEDPSFTGVLDASVVLEGPVASIALSVGVNGYDRPLSLAVQVTK